MPRKLTRNLNKKLDRKLHRLPSVNNIRIFFCPEQMIAALTCRIKRSSTIVGCVAWVTHPKILSALETVDATLIMTKHKSNHWKRRIKVKYVGFGRGKKAALMHHKFLVGVDDQGPAWVSFGSFNLTNGGMTNLENMVIAEDRSMAKVFYQEYTSILAL